ncbi:MAG: hypothetical protein HY393_00550 [Candidatus Diapherotrites archaeon]|nr:hypothetical protein [Candidatus Diapherotrites archaeon]
MDTALLNQIKEIRKKGDFHTIRKKIGDENLRGFICDLYPAHTITELKKILEVPDSTLGYWFKHLNIPPIRHHASIVSLPASFTAQAAISNGKIATIYSATEITPELAYLIGFALGDESVQKYMVEVFNQDRKLREHLHPILKKYGTVTEDERENGLWRLRLSSVKIANLIKTGKKIREDTIDYILSNDDLARQFIAAFWDAEGTARRQDKNYHLYLYNTNEALLERIGAFLASKGIKFSKYSRFDKGRVCFFNGHEIRTTKPLYRLSIPKESRHTWVSEIGIYLKHSKKKATVEEIEEGDLDG